MLSYATSRLEDPPASRAARRGAPLRQQEPCFRARQPGFGRSRAFAPKQTARCAHRSGWAQRAVVPCSALESAASGSGMSGHRRPANHRLGCPERRAQRRRREYRAGRYHHGRHCSSHRCRRCQLRVRCCRRCQLQRCRLFPRWCRRFRRSSQRTERRRRRLRLRPPSRPPCRCRPCLRGPQSRAFRRSRYPQFHRSGPPYRFQLHRFRR
jgi:hypothetical protein